MLYGKPRDAFLGFLRNLTPQVLFLTCFFFILKLLDQPLPKDKTLLFAGCLGCFLVFILAFMANCFQFLESFPEGQSEALDKAFERIKRSDSSNWNKAKSRFLATWKHNKFLLVQVFLAIGIVVVSLFPITMAVVQVLEKNS